MTKFILHTISLFIIAGFFVLSFIFVLFFITPIPSFSVIGDVKVIESIKVFDRNEELLFDFSEDIQREYIPLESISNNIISATLAIEDSNFYSHHGVDLIAIFRSFIVNLQTRSFSQGGSTITQQVIKNTLLTSEKRIIRKLKEIFIALRIELALPKEDILEAYLNTVSYGGVIFGVSQASGVFFNKTPSELTIAEAAYLAAIPRAPTYYSPYGNNKGNLENRKNLVLSRMFAEKFISREEYLTALGEQVFFHTRDFFSIKAPHFVFFVREKLEDEFGSDLGVLQGAHIQTTIDYELQEEVQGLVTKFIDENKKKLGAENASVIIMNPETGEILAMIGSIDYFDKNIDGKVNATVSLRQPGSTLKPFIYANLLDNGFRPETILFDAQTQFSSECEKDDFSSEDNCYSPVNYTDGFSGPISIREALAQSINIPAVKSLYLAGIDKVFKLLKDININLGSDYSNYGLSLVLGGVEVPLLNLVNAYSIFPNSGEFVSANWILEDDLNKIKNGKISPSKRIISKQTAFDINSILSDNIARQPVFGNNRNLIINNSDVAVKTGTTNNARDIWIVGYTPELIVGVWSGNNNGDPLNQNSAGVSLAPLWKNIIELTIDKYSLSGSFFQKNTSPKLDNVPPIIKGDWWNSNNTDDIHSILHSIDSDSDLSIQIEDGRLSNQYENWEYGIENWLKEDSSKSVLESSLNNKKPKIQQNSIFQILSPFNNQIFKTEDNITISIISSISDIFRYDYYINNKLIGTSHIQNFNFVPSFLDIGIGKQLIRVIGYGKQNNLNISEVFIEIKD